MTFSRRAGLRFNRGRLVAFAAAPSGGGGGDVTPPGVSSIVGNAAGNSIRVTFTEAMQTVAGSTPAPGDLAIPGTQATVGSLTWASATELDIAVATQRFMGTSFETVLLSYTQGANTLKDAAGNLLPSFANAAVTNSSIHAPMVEIQTRFTTGSNTWTSPVDLHGTSCLVKLWGGGQAGTLNVEGGDAGYYCEKTDTIAPDTGYSEVIGAGGVAPALAGGDSTWRATVCVAPGGASITTPVGDVTRVGGLGGTGGGAKAGGASSGTDSAATTVTPGAPNGAPGVNADRTARIPGSGGPCTAGAQRDGAQGCRQLRILRAPPLTGPYITATEEYRVATSAAHAVAAPGTHVAGDIILLLSSVNGAATQSSDEATEVVETAQSTNLSQAVFARTADGTDTITVDLSVSAIAEFRVFRIRGSTGIANVEATPATGTTSAPATGTHTPTGGSVQRLAIAACTSRANANANHLLTGMPAGYEGAFMPQPTDTTSVAQAWGAKLEAAASYSGTFTGTLSTWAAHMVTVE